MRAYRRAKAWILDNPSMSPPQAFVLLMIADHYNDTARRAWPAIETLTKETRLSRATVKRSLSDLRDMGVVLPETWIDEKSGRRLPNRYCLPLFDYLSQPSPDVVRGRWDTRGLPLGVKSSGVEIEVGARDEVTPRDYPQPVDDFVPW